MSAAVGAQPRLSNLVVPEYDPEAPSWNVATAWIKQGFYVEPVAAQGDAKHAGSVLGKGWHLKTSRDQDKIDEWFIGTSHLVAVHVGRSGAWAADLDAPEHITPELARAEAELHPPTQYTRGLDDGHRHLLFAQPQGRDLGNSTGKLGRAWGEARGRNGIIRVGGAGRIWHPAGAVPVLPDYIAGLVPDAGETEVGASSATVASFAREHATGERSDLLRGVSIKFRKLLEEERSARHVALVDVACMAAREARAGAYAAENARYELLAAWMAVREQPAAGGRIPTGGEWAKEFAETWAWAVAQARALTVEECRARMANPNGLSNGSHKLNGASPRTPDDFFGGGGVSRLKPAGVQPPMLAVVPPVPAAEEVDERPLGSWTAVDLGPYLEGAVERPAPSLGAARTDGVQFLYPGKEHSCIGEMECGKSWFALACVAAELDKGNRVLYIHFEEDDPTDTLVRLQLLGVSTSRILAGFDFVGPESPISLGVIEHYTEVPPALVVLDGVNEAMALHGQGIREEDGAAAYRARLVKPFTRVNAAVLSLDHVVKDSEKSSKGYALGSIHKGNGLSGSLILLENEEPFGEGRRGASRVYITKDRPGKIRKHGTPTTTPRKFFLGMMAIDAQHPGSVALDIWAPKAEQAAATVAAEAPEDELGAQILAVVGDLTDGDDGDGWARTSAITGRIAGRRADVLRKLDELKGAGKVLREQRGQAHVWQLCSTGSQDQESE